MKKTYINPETEVTRIAPVVMAATSGVLEGNTQSGFRTTDDTSGNLGKDDNYGGPNLWD